MAWSSSSTPTVRRSAVTRELLERERPSGLDVLFSLAQMQNHSQTGSVVLWFCGSAAGRRSRRSVPPQERPEYEFSVYRRQ